MTLAVQENRPVVRTSTAGLPKVLQPHRASTSPYADCVVDLPCVLRGPEKWLRRWVPEPIAAGWELFWRRNHYDVAVTADYRTALIFGALTNLFGRTCLHVVKELYLDEGSLRSFWKQRLFRWALRGADCVITNCSAEMEAYSRFLGLPPERFRFLPWPSNLAPRRSGRNDGYIFAAGRSFRDWPVLFAAAREIDAPFVVVAEAAAVEGLDRPDNLTLYCDVDRRTYLDLLEGAAVVLVPLCRTVRSVGQAAILEAMALGKPTITADVPGVLDYIVAGRSGLFYETGNHRSLVEQLTRLWQDSAYREYLGTNALEAVRHTFNKARYARDMFDLVVELLGGKN